jgi:hypothetical protein
MRISLSQVVVLGTGVLVFCGIVGLRMHTLGAPGATQPGAAATARVSSGTAAMSAAIPASPPVASSTSQPVTGPKPAVGSATPALIQTTAAAPLPEVPVSVVLSPAPGDGHSALLQSEATEPLLVKLTITNRKIGHKYTTELTVPAYGTAQVDGVPAERGDQVTLASNGFKDQVTYFQ